MDEVAGLAVAAAEPNATPRGAGPAGYDVASAKVQGLASKADPQFETSNLWQAK
jgi:hypothetical protein